jgi:uncharacterized membrane protein
MSTLLLASAMKHFREPSLFYGVVPDFICRRDLPMPGPVNEAPGIKRAQVAEPERGTQAPPSNGTLAVMSREEWVAASGLLEAGAAVGLLIPATRKAAAAFTAAMFTAFIAGHVDALRKAWGPEGTAAQRQVSAARLPLQLPLILWAWSLRTAPTGRACGVP